MAKPFKRKDGLWCQQIELPPKPDGTRRRKYLYARTKTELAAKVREAQRDIDRTGDILTNAPTLARWLEHWLAEIATPALRPKTIANYRHMTGLIATAIGRVRIDKLTPAHVRQLERHLISERGLSSTTARNAHAVLRKALNDAMTEGVAHRNAAELVKAPPKAHYEATYLTATQGADLLRSVAHDPRAAIRWSLALLLGLRQGEALGLRASHVNLTSGTIAVEWQLQRLDDPPRRGSKHVDLGNSYYLTPPKTGSGARVLPLVEPLASMMRAYLPTLPGPDAFVCGPGIVDERTDARAWKRVLREAGLPDVRLHSARHTTLTLLAQMGVPEHVRQAIAGHASAEVLRVYTHADSDEVRQAISGLGEILTLPPAKG